MTGPGSTSSNAEVQWLSSSEEQAWIGLMALVLRLPGMLDSQLRESGLGMFDYMVLGSLSMSADRTLRMSTLAELANGSLSRLSNVVKRLESQGWIRREPDAQDGRFTVAILTDAGWDKVVAAAPGHVRAVRHLVLDPLSAAQIEQLSAIGHQIDQRIRTGLPCLPPAENDCSADC